jgi:hypothetical protein
MTEASGAIRLDAPSDDVVFRDRNDGSVGASIASHATLFDPF